VAYSERPIHEALIDTRKSSALILEAIQHLKKIVDNNQESRKEQTQQLLAALEDRVAKLAQQQSKTETSTSAELDRLAAIVNKMESHYRQQMPDYLRSVSLTTDMTWASPTLLCLKLKEEYLRIEQEYNNLRSQLSTESNTYLSDNNALKEQVRSLTHQLADITAKYAKEKEEKDRIMMSLMGKDKEAFDAVRFQALVEENDTLKRSIDDLKFKLATEKSFKINQLFEEQEATAKLASMNTELNTLMNVKLELMAQIQAINAAHALRLAEKENEINHWKQENTLMGDKIVNFHLQDCFEQSCEQPQVLHSGL
jgi:hypothetical protein